VALNFDGDVVINRGVAGRGCVIHDSEGNLRVVFSFYNRLIWVESESLMAIKPIKDGCKKGAPVLSTRLFF